MEYPKITELVREQARFEYYRDNIMYYSVQEFHFEPRWVFQIPIGKETKGGTFNKTEKAIHLMRFIRKAIEDKTLTPFV